jgi:hypothetical protein
MKGHFTCVLAAPAGTPTASSLYFRVALKWVAAGYRRPTNGLQVNENGEDWNILLTCDQATWQASQFEILKFSHLSLHGLRRCRPILSST